MAITDADGLLIAVWTTVANRHEVKLAQQTIDSSLLNEPPVRIIADKAYDSDPLREELAEQSIDLIVPHRKNRKKPKKQDGRKLRRYRRRWKVERYFAWLHNYRRCVVRYDFYNRNFEGFILIATMAIYLKKYF